MGAVLPLKVSRRFCFTLVSLAFFGAGLTSGLRAQMQTNSAQANPAAAGLPPDEAVNLGPSSSVASAALLNSMDALNNDRKLAAGDQISYRVIEEQKDPIFLTLNATGELQVPLLGLYPAAGKTCRELAKELKPILQKDYFYQATVIVGLEAQSTRSLGKVYLMGYVKNQGALELPSNEPITVSKAVLLNGGLADFADRHHVKLIRKGPNGKNTTTNVDIDAIMKGKSTYDPVLQPGDTINVLEKLFNI